MNEQELLEIERREQAATPGPWSMKQDGADFYMADSKGQYLDITLADAIFASHARKDIPALLQEVRRLQAEKQELAGLLAKFTVSTIRLSAALEFYANPKNWKYEYKHSDFKEPEINSDKGRIAREALKGGSQSTCKWNHDQDHENDVWETSCGNAVVFDEGEPKDHGYEFCHYCGKTIEFVENEKGGEG